MTGHLYHPTYFVSLEEQSFFQKFIRKQRDTDLQLPSANRPEWQQHPYSHQNMSSNMPPQLCARPVLSPCHKNKVNTYKLILQRTISVPHSCRAPASTITSTTSSCWKDAWINEPKDILRKSRKCTCTVNLNLVNTVMPLKQETDTFFLMVSVFPWSSSISGILWIFLQPSWLICTAGCWWGTRSEIRRNGLFSGFL